jgi:putative aldouronate transport system substrate-binding protein
MDACITSACKYPEVAVRWLDYHYGEDGANLFNYGILNDSYTIENGKPQYTDKVLKNPEFGYDVAAWKYKLHEGPFLRDIDAIPAGSQTMQDARNKFWNTTDASYELPTQITLSTEENEKYLEIMNEVWNEVDVKVLEFMIGKRNMNEFDAFVDKIKSMGIDDAIKIQQTALDRYNKR